MTTPPEGTQPPPGPQHDPSGFGGGPSGGYGNQPSGQPQDGPPTDVVSIVGLVLAFLLAPIGLVVSIVGLTRTAGGRRKGRGFAIAGIIVSVVVSLIVAAVTVAVVSLVKNASEDFGATLDELQKSFPTGEPLPNGEAFPTEPLPSAGPLPEDTAAPPLTDPEVVDPASLLALGEAADLGGLRLSVTGVDLEADAVVAAESADNPPPTGRYVLVSGTVQNTTTEVQGVYLGLNVAYVSAGGSPYDELTCSATVAGAAANATDLEPGASADVRWCLDVPVEEVGDGSVQVDATSGEGSAAWSDR